jgi:uncharacterized OB-fold protein
MTGPQAARPETTGPQPPGPQADWTRGAPVVLVSACPDCGHRWYIARPRCPRCASPDVQRHLAAGTGTVAAVTSVSPQLIPDGAGVSIALVDLDDGIRIMARAAPDLAVGARVQWFFPACGQSAGQRPVPHVKVVEH